MTTLNRIPLPLDLEDTLALLKKDIFLNFNSHHVGRIENFNEANQTAVATLTYQKQFFDLNKKTGNYEPILLPYPLLADCPVIILGGGASALTFPIQTGDECLVLFNDRDIDSWFHSGGGAAPNSSRLHSFADGIILVGLRNSQRSLTNYDTSRAVLRNGDPTTSGAMVGVSATHIKIANNLTTLNTLLQSLITQIQLITVLCATPGNASSPPINAAALALIGTQLGQLLE